MKTVHKFSVQHSRFMLGGLLLNLGLLAFLNWQKTPAVPVMEAQQGAAAIEQLKKDGSYPSLAAALNAARYQMNQQGGAWRAENQAQRFSAHFTTSEVRISDSQLETKTPWQIGMKLASVGRGEKLTLVGTGELNAQGERIELRKGGITEWYVNQPEGLEQGFTLHSPIPQLANLKAPAPVRLSLQLSGDLRAKATGHQTIRLQDKQGRAVLGYDHLAAWDAQHKALPATMTADGDTITLEVDDAGAVYPVTIDPLLTQTNQLIASDGAQSDRLGKAIALSGDTAIVGAEDDDVSFADQGSAYVFVRNGAAWTQQQKLTANDAQANAHFGNAVAIDGNTIVVGAAEAAFNGMLNYGAAYVFTRSGATWTQQQKLSLSNSDAQTYFGSAVAVRGNTAAIGAYREDGPVFGFPEPDTGAVYIFTRTGATWMQQARVQANDAEAFAQLGGAVALHGETLLVGAHTANDKGAAYLFTRSGANWSQQAKLIASDGGTQDFFGESVALGQDVAVIGAPQADVNGQNNQGAAYVYARSGNAWTQHTKLTASDGAATHNFGRAVAFNGACIAVGASRVPIGGVSEAGAAYLFTRNGANWTQQQKFSANDSGLQNYFGSAVALSDSYLIAGAWGAEVNGNSQQGAAYAFQLSHRYPLWDTLAANDGTANDHFGQSLVLDGTVAVIGAPGEDVNGAADQGAAYVFTRNSDFTWSFQQKLTQGAAGDEFGYSVASSNSGATLLIGAPADDVFGSANQGSVYIYTRLGNTWNLVAPIFAADPAAGQEFGTSVALFGGRAIIGAPYATISGKLNQGAAYVFTGSGNVWTQQAKLTSNDGQASNLFGRDVAVDSTTALIGAHNHQVGGNANQGAAYVYLFSGGAWSQQAKLTANDGALNDFFGTAVALSGDTALIGADGDDPAGAAYVFTRTGATWSQQAKLKASDESSQFARFGGDVALDGDVAAAGAWLATPNGVNNQGAAYVFTRTGSVWAQQQKLLLPDGAAGDQFGYAVAASDNGAVLVGAPFRNGGQGGAYFFLDRSPLGTTPGTLPAGTAGVAYNQTLTSFIGVAPYSIFLVNGALPAGLTLVSDVDGTATLSGTPLQTGAFAFTVGVSDAKGGYGTTTYTLTINCATINLTPTTLPPLSVGQFYNQQLTVSGGIAPYTYAKTAGTFPAGVIINFAGQLVGTPSTAGSGSFTITATDVNGCSAAQSYNFTVGCATLTINPATLPGGTVGQGGYNQPLSASGGTAPYTFSLNPGDTLPPGLALTNGAITGGPQQGGTFNFTLRVTDAQGCQGTRAYTFTATCQTLNVFPATLPGMTVGAPFNQGISASGSDGPYTVTLDSGALPGGITLANGALTGTPTASGNGAFTLKIADVYGCFTLKQYNYNIGCPAVTLTPPALPNGATGVAYNQTLTAAGGLAPYSYSVTAGALPPGLALAAGGALTGTPTQAGQFNFSVTASFGGGCTGSQSYALTITQSCGTLTITPATLPNGAVGVAYNQQLTATGGTGNIAYAVTSGGLSAGLTLTPGGLLAGTPTQSTVINFTVTATDANGCTGQKSYVLTVTCPTITIGPATLPNGTTGTAYNQQLTQSGGVGTVAFGVSAGSLPAGLNLSNTGLISGTPTQTGAVNFTVTAADANTCLGTKQYTLTINGPACPTLTITPATLPTIFLNVPYNRQLSASGGTGPYTFSIVSSSLPAPGLSITPAGLLTGTISIGAGTFGLTVKAIDANGCSKTLGYNMTIQGCPTINISPNPPSPAFVGMPYQHTFNATGGIAPYTYSLAQGPIPDGLTLSTAGVLSGTPTGNNGGGFAFTVKATDANGCMGQVPFGLTIANCPTITVNPATLPNGQAGTSYSQQLSASGGSAPYAFALVSGSSLPNGLTLSGTGLLSGTPTVFGSFNFTVKATATGGCPGTRAYTLTITAPCAAITVNPASLPNGTVGTTYNQTVTAAGGTGPYSFTVSAGALPGGLALNTSGALTGTPNAAGLFNFTVKATDASGCQGTRAYAVTINSNVVNNGLQFYPLPAPLRLLDTRPGQVGCDAPGTQIPGGTSRNQLARRTCEGITIPANARAITGNITTVQSGGGYLTLYPSDAAQPLVANSNYNPNEVLNNVFTVGLGNADGSFKIFVTSNTHVVVDVTGYYAPPAAGGLYFHPLPKPIRLLETRAGFNGAFTPGLPLQASTDTLQAGLVTYDGVTIPATALTLVGNATVVNNSAGYLTLYPGGVPRPLAASSNFIAGQIMNAPFTVGLSAAGQFNIFTTANTDLVIDVLGYYSADATDANSVGLLFNPLAAPVRLLETRAGFTGCYTPDAPLLPASIRNQQARGVCDGQTIAANALAIVGNATVVNAQAGYLTFWPNGAAQPLVAASNFNTGQVLNRHFTVGLGATGMFNLFTPSQTDLVIDVSGFFAP